MADAAVPKMSILHPAGRADWETLEKKEDLNLVQVQGEKGDREIKK